MPQPLLRHLERDARECEVAGVEVTEIVEPTAGDATAALSTATFDGGARCLNGKTERSHRIDDEEFYRPLERATISAIAKFNNGSESGTIL